MMFYISGIALLALILTAHYLSKKAPQGKIAITGRQPLDSRHALISIKWEEKEYLLLVGGQSSCVVGERSEAPQNNEK